MNRNYKESKTNKKSAKPFLKWAGGKGQILKEIEEYYPFNERIDKYAEPFVGGGAVLFDILSRYQMKEVYISDVNLELINTYKVVRSDIENLIRLLTKIQDEYIPLEMQDRKKYYLDKREKFNKITLDKNNISLDKAALMIFLNKTCFNGLFRVNKKGLFNVPSGTYKNPKICDVENLRLVSKKLKNVDINYGDYKKASEFIDDRTFVYFDPPYRPLTNTASFTAYSKTDFADKEQIELADFVMDMAKRGAKVLVSNSDPKNSDPEDEFFDDIYSGFKIERIQANRMINSKGKLRGKINELLITNI